MRGFTKTEAKLHIKALELTHGPNTDNRELSYCSKDEKIKINFTQTIKNGKYYMNRQKLEI